MSKSELTVGRRATFTGTGKFCLASAAKQRKRILYAEKNIAADTSAKKNVKIFRTKFEITFGIVFGSDLLLESTLSEIREAKVQNILVLTAWLNDPCSSSISRRLLFSLISYSENLNLFVADSSDFSSSGIYFTEGANLLLEEHVQTLTVCSNPAVNRYLPTAQLNVNAIFSKNVLDQVNYTETLTDDCKERSSLCFNYLGENVNNFHVLDYKESCNIVYPWNVSLENNRFNEMKIYIGGILGKSDSKSERVKREAVASGKVVLIQPTSDMNALELDKHLVYRQLSKNANTITGDVQNLLFVGFFKVEAIVAGEPSVQTKDSESAKNKQYRIGENSFILVFLFCVCNGLITALIWCR